MRVLAVTHEIQFEFSGDETSDGRKRIWTIRIQAHEVPESWEQGTPSMHSYLLGCVARAEQGAVRELAAMGVTVERRT